MNIKMRMSSNVVKELETSVGLTMYWLNSNRICVTKVHLHMVVSRFLKDLWLQMQTTTLNMALAFKSRRRNDS